jgi:DNA-binding NarL/FixJ family response regulator
MKMPRVLLADDHAIVAQGIGALLEDEFDLIGKVVDGAALVKTACRMRPDVIVSDISMPEMSGIEALRRIKRQVPNVKMIFLTMHGDAKLAAEALREGAVGYLLKHSAGEELSIAIREVLQGRVYLTPRIAKEVLAAVSSPPDRTLLTPRQLDVLRLVAQGKSFKQIATALNISPRTVESHKYEMMQVLDLTTTAELIRYALDRERTEAELLQ